MKRSLLIILLTFFTFGANWGQAITMQVDAAKPLGPLQPFWKATGFMPATLLETPGMQESLRRMAATNPRAIEYIRPHFLLDLVTLEKGVPNWTRFDAVMDFLVRDLSFKLVFEVMGNPSNRFDFTKAEDVQAWQDFVQGLAVHLQQRYGEETVRAWWFECWNEPDIEFFWKTGDDSFLAYYDATWNGLKAADPALRFGGPAHSKGLTDFFRRWVRHVTNKKNADFISVHRKFLPRKMIAEERSLLAFVREINPALAQAPFLNTEADPEFGWANKHWWRGHAWYAAFVAQSIDLHLRELRDRDGVNYALGLNDNGFVGGFGERTLYAHFPQPDGSVTLVKKPVMAGMELLARLGSTRLTATVNDAKAAEDFGIIATRAEEGTLSLLVYSCPPIGAPTEAKFPAVPPWSSKPTPVQIMVRGAGFDKAQLKTWLLDDQQGNPLSHWVTQGSPIAPTPDQLAVLRAAEGPCLQPATEVTANASGEFILPQTLRPGSVQLLQLTPHP